MHFCSPWHRQEGAFRVAWWCIFLIASGSGSMKNDSCAGYWALSRDSAQDAGQCIFAALVIAGRESFRVAWGAFPVASSFGSMNEAPCAGF